MSDPKRPRVREVLVFSETERSCGAVWFEGLPDGTSVITLAKRLVELSHGKLQHLNVRVRPRSQRGGVLVHFEPKYLSSVAYDIVDGLGFSDIRVHPPTQARESSKTDVVAFNVPSIHADDDLLYFFEPKPVRVERFKRRDGTVSRTVRVSFGNQTDSQIALQNGIKLDRLILRCKPFVSAPPVFCRRCKEFGAQHLDCAVVCAKCKGNHPTSICNVEHQDNNVECLKCKGPHLFFKCPEVSKRRAEAVRRRQSNFSGHKTYKDALLVPQRNHVDVASVVQNTALSLIPTIIEATLGELSGHGYLGDTELTHDFYSHVQELVVKNFNFDKFSADLVEENELKSRSDSSPNKTRDSYNNSPVCDDDDVSISGISEHSQSSTALSPKTACRYCGTLYHKKGLRTHEIACSKKKRMSQ